MSWTNTVDMTRPWIRERAQGRTRTAVWTDGCARLVIHDTTVSDDAGDRRDLEAWLDDGHGITATLSSPGTTDPDRLAVTLGALADKARASLAEARRRAGVYDPKPVAAHAWREPDGASPPWAWIPWAAWKAIALGMTTGNRYCMLTGHYRSNTSVTSYH